MSVTCLISFADAQYCTFVPVNIETPNTVKKAPPPKIIEKPKKVVVVGADPEEIGTVTKEKESTEKATDDFHFEKFKKQFRRY